MSNKTNSKRRSSPGNTSANTSSSTSPGAGGDDEMSANLTLMSECPNCSDYVVPVQCCSGHILCWSCCYEINGCSHCCGHLANIRNLERVTSNPKFSCKYLVYGCTASLDYTEKNEHEVTCEYRQYSCPCPGASCSWRGPLDLIMLHLKISHKGIKTLEGEGNVFLATNINLPGNVNWVTMQSCFGHHFMLVLQKQEKFDGHQQFFAIVQLIGSRKEAEHYLYRLELNGIRRSLKYEAIPRSLHEGIASAIYNLDCLVFDTSVAQLFADNGDLGINVTISLV